MTNSAHSSIIFQKTFQQPYRNIKIQCLRSCQLFVDDKFPTMDRSLYFMNNNSRQSTVKWIRAKELVNNPEFFIETYSTDLLENKTFAITWINEIEENRLKIMPIDQSFSSEYCGLFHFRFWQTGSWIEVVIDDFLPVDANNELIYSRNCKNKNEFWIPLIEKAYAKLNGCYAMLKNLRLDHCLVDLTGCLIEVLDINRLVREQKTLNSIRKNSKTLLKMIKRAKLNGSISLAEQTKPHDAAKSANGIEELYEITDVDDKLSVVVFASIKKQQNQPKNDQQEESDDVRKCAPFVEFLEEIERFHLAHINLMNLKFSSKRKNKQDRWDYRQMYGKWAKSKDGEPDIAIMPQHTVNLKKTGDCERSMIVSLMALDYKEKKNNTKGLTPLAFHVYRLTKRYKTAELTFSKQNYEMTDLKRVGKSGDKYVYEREVCRRFLINKGVYVVVPLTVNNQIETPYLLRIFTENLKKTGKNDDDDDEEREIDDPEEFEILDDNESADDSEDD